MNIRLFKETARILDPSIALMVKGPHGIGKSQIIGQVAEELGLELVVFMCSQIGDVGDFIGLPKHQEYVNRFFKRNRVTGEEIELTSKEYMEATKDETWELYSVMDIILDKSKEIEVGKGEIVTLTEFCPPYWYKKNKNYALFLDEINRARPEIGNAAMQLTLEKKILNLRLTPGSRIFSAINPAKNAKYGIEEMAPAQLDRWMIVELKPEVDEFIEYGESHGIHEAVLNYIEANPRNLLPWDNEELTNMASKDSESKVPTPRSYEMLSKAIYSFEKVDKDYFKRNGGEKLLTEIVRGCVGPGVALTFTESYFARSITPEVALKDPEGCKELLASYHAGRQKRFLNNMNKYLDELLNGWNIQFNGKELMTGDNKLIENIKKVQYSYCTLINTVKFEVAASVFNKAFVEDICNEKMWVRILLLERLKFNGETIELKDGARLKKNYIKNAVEVI